MASLATSLDPRQEESRQTVKRVRAIVAEEIPDDFKAEPHGRWVLRSDHDIDIKLAFATTYTHFATGWTLRASGPWRRGGDRLCLRKQKAEGWTEKALRQKVRDCVKAARDEVERLAEDKKHRTAQAERQDRRLASIRALAAKAGMEWPVDQDSISQEGTDLRLRFSREGSDGKLKLTLTKTSWTGGAGDGDLVQLFKDLLARRPHL